MSAKLVGNPDWVIQPDYPELSGEEGDEQVTVKIVATAKGLQENLPFYGDPFKSDDPFFSGYRFLVLTTRTVKCDAGRKTYSVTLSYGTPDGSDSNTEATVRREVEYQTQDVDIPLEQHPKYRTCWNHVLLAKIGIDATPEWWGTATDTKISSADAQNFAWGKPGDQPPDGWYCRVAETKKGVESYRQGICTVNAIDRSTNKNYLTRSAQKDYTIQTPPDTFGRSGQWLRGGSLIRKNGRYWELSVSYLNSLVWDKDLYD